ncbi:hypothetical protein HPB51_027384 [Rhipicephalus microplus]|uniref:Uncharacterized protein n=1 Tax=Rhipicephalus microplus TaxID=6941 RepID=A0A9J6D0R4_RHIMP|nr:hypothetical protein HPB51_027384 [Rhipicephalus microplus]
MMTRSWIYADKQTHRCAVVDKENGSFGRAISEGREIRRGEAEDQCQDRISQCTKRAATQRVAGKQKRALRPAEQRHRLEAESAHKSRQTCGTPSLHHKPRRLWATDANVRGECRLRQAAGAFFRETIIPFPLEPPRSTTKQRFLNTQQAAYACCCSWPLREVSTVGRSWNAAQRRARRRERNLSSSFGTLSK